MKKLIVLSVVFALVASAAFAVDLGGTVTGTVNLFEGEAGNDASGASDDITGSGTLNRVRIDGGGEAGEGKFGGYFRAEGFNSIIEQGNLTGNSWEGEKLMFFKAYGNVWWKPIDQIKLILGSNGGDGFYGKEGNTGWMFYQTVSDTGIVNAGNCWGGGYGGAVFRDAFYGGDGGGNALRLEITPLDILGININLPYWNGGKTEDIFKSVTAQIDLKLDFGNIALTYQSASGDGTDQPKIFVYYGGSFGDLALDVGLKYQPDNKDPSSKNRMGVGAGVKYATDAFGVKFRVVAALAGEDADGTDIVADVLPYFSLGDNITAFISVGLAMNMPDEGDSVIGWHFNPYVQIGEDWGAKFLVGVRVWSAGGDDAKTSWNVPIAISVSF